MIQFASQLAFFTTWKRGKVKLESFPGRGKLSSFLESHIATNSRPAARRTKKQKILQMCHPHSFRFHTANYRSEIYIINALAPLPLLVLARARSGNSFRCCTVLAVHATLVIHFIYIVQKFPFSSPPPVSYPVSCPVYEADLTGGTRETKRKPGFSN